MRRDVLSFSGNITPDKAANIKHARAQIDAAVLGSKVKPDVLVLPEYVVHGANLILRCFNSLYGVDHFDGYAEEIGFETGKAYDVASSPSETVKMLSEAAKSSSVWLFGGTCREVARLTHAGSIPERGASNKLYNTATVFNPDGQLIAIHRSVRSSYVRSSAQQAASLRYRRAGHYLPGEQDPHWRRQSHDRRH